MSCCRVCMCSSVAMGFGRIKLTSYTSKKCCAGDFFHRFLQRLRKLWRKLWFGILNMKGGKSKAGKVLKNVEHGESLIRGKGGTPTLGPSNSGGTTAMGVRGLSGHLAVGVFAHCELRGGDLLCGDLDDFPGDGVPLALDLQEERLHRRCGRRRALRRSQRGRHRCHTSRSEWPLTLNDCPPPPMMAWPGYGPTLKRPRCQVRAVEKRWVDVI